MILRGIFHLVSRFPLHFMLYRGNLDLFSDSVVTFFRCSILFRDEMTLMELLWLDVVHGSFGRCGGVLEIVVDYLEIH